MGDAQLQLSDWVDFGRPGVARVRMGKVEIGQGILTSMAQLAADELGLDVASVEALPAATDRDPDTGATSGSLSLQVTGAVLRSVCAEVRSLLDKHRAGRSAELTYWDLPPGALDRPLLGRTESWAPDQSVSDPAVGRSVPRVDLPDKVHGRPRFIHDLRLPGQLFGRVVRPPGPGATLVDVDDSSARLEGVVEIVHSGRCLGVIAEREETAVSAAERLGQGATWREGSGLPDPDDLVGWLKSAPSDALVVHDRQDETVRASITRRHAASYLRPFVAHASLAPSCGIAVWRHSNVEVWSHSQGIHALRRSIAAAIGLPDDQVVVRHVEGAGCYGHNGADDAAFDAVLLARAVPGRPVQVVWSRQDELGWSPFGSAMTIDLAAGLADDGRILSWRHDVWSAGHTSRPGADDSPRLLAASHMVDEDPPPAIDPPFSRGGGSTRNAVPLYDVADCTVIGHLLTESPLRTSALRSLGATANVFAIESFLEELADAAGVDPVDYRLRHLTDPRARAVIEAAASIAGWSGSDRGDASGAGVGFAQYKNTGAYCAVVAEVEAVTDVRVRRLVVAADVGLVVNPDGAANQLEGGAVQATSWTLHEEVTFDRDRVTSTDWESYPILRFDETPEVRVELIDRPSEPPLGAGEAAQGPTTAAIANAARAAIGVPLRRLPLTPERIIAAIEAAEVTPTVRT